MMRVLDPADFVPETWRHGQGVVHMFNPGLAELHGRRILAYRLVLADRRRRLAICALDSADRPVAGSAVALSGLMPEAGPWQADPRLFAQGDRLFLHFNTGDRPRPNSICLVELDALSLTPLGPARPLALAGTRRPVEKNWMLFSPDQAEVLAVYSIDPHVMVRVQPDTGECHTIATMAWRRPASAMGEPRGGTTPVRVGDVYYAFFHMTGPAPLAARLLHRLRHRRSRRLHRYHIGFYGFEAGPPFRPVCFTPDPIIALPPRERGAPPPLNRDAQRVLYPTGALFDGTRWTVAAGLHDTRCCMLTFDHAELLQRTVRIA